MDHAITQHPPAKARDHASTTQIATAQATLPIAVPLDIARTRQRPVRRQATVIPILTATSHHTPHTAAKVVLATIPPRIAIHLAALVPTIPIATYMATPLIAV